jgi:hypothetical protein
MAARRQRILERKGITRGTTAANRGKPGRGLGFDGSLKGKSWHRGGGKHALLVLPVREKTATGALSPCVR